MTRRIYFLLPYYPNWFDGGNKYQTIVFNSLKKKHKELYFFGRSVDVKKSKYKILNLFFKLTHIIRIAFALAHIIRIPRHSIIVLNNAYFLDYSLPAALNKLWKNHVYIMFVHHLVQKDRPTYFRKKLENYFIRKAKVVIAVSNTTYHDLDSLGLISKRTFIVTPGLDVDINKIPAFKSFPDIFNILYVGSVEKKKGLIYLVEALGKLKSKNFKVDIVGKYNFDDYFVMLDNRISKLNLSSNVCFHGRVEREKLSSFYLRASVFVFPSLWEGYGMAVAEALAFGLPVIASKIPALEKLISDEKDGILFDPQNSNQIRDALNRFLNNEKLLVEFSRNASIKAKSFPTWGESIEKVWYYIERIL